MTLIRVLFVDDEQELLEGLRDLLRPRRREWRMDFVLGGHAALGKLDEHAYDVVVTDMRMPGMDGAALLAEVQHRQPNAIRIVLSGYAEAAAVARAARVAHRFIGKPCDPAELSRMIERSIALGALTETEGLRRAAVRTTDLPRLPELHRRLTALLDDGRATLEDAATLVAQDIAVCASVLQLANCAFFNRARPVTGLHEAVAYVGLQTLSAMTLAAGAVAELRPARPIPGFSLEDVQTHGAHVARVARKLLSDPRMQDDAVSAAMLHDIGLLILAVEEPDYLAAVLAAARDEGRSAVEIEYEWRGISHAEVGAHLLALWGLPHELVEAVAFHHRPDAAPRPTLDAVAAVHIADALVRDEPLDDDYIAALGVEHRVPEWRALAQRETVVAPTAAILRTSNR
jgi:HD-like signal output (HDOD) protein/ActR/RegA family two-component response regulator